MQTLFVATGCDYVSFFSGIGKTFFLKVFFEYAKFIAVDLSGPFIDSQFAFFRLVGCAYFKKHANTFCGHTPSSLMNLFSDNSSSSLATAVACPERSAG